MGLKEKFVAFSELQIAAMEEKWEHKRELRRLGDE